MAAIQTSPLAVLSLAVSAGITQLTVNVLSDSATQDPSADYNPGLYIDGVWSAELVVVNQAGINAIAINLDGSAHTLEIWNSYQGFKQGSFVYSYSVTGGAGTVTVNPVTTTARMGVLYTDSIGCAALAVPATQLGWTPRLRALYPGRLAIEGWGGRALWDDSGTLPGQQGLGSIANLAACLTGFVAGGTTRDVLIQIGVNDALFGGLGRWSAASFGTALAQLLDAIHAADTGARVFLASPLITNSEATVNAFGNTLPQYRTQCSTAASGRAWVTFTDGTTMMTATGIGADPLHPVNVGHQAVALGTGAAAGATSWRTVLGV
jgi:hypothetical protein